MDRNVTFLGVLLYLRNIYCTGLAINEIELEKIADHFDRDHDGFIDLNEIISILGCNYRERSLAKRRPVTDSQKIDQAVRDESLHNYYIHTHYTTTT